MNKYNIGDVLVINNNLDAPFRCTVTEVVWRDNSKEYSYRFDLEYLPMTLDPLIWDPLILKNVKCVGLAEIQLDDMGTVIKRGGSLYIQAQKKTL